VWPPINILADLDRCLHHNSYSSVSFSNCGTFIILSNALESSDPRCVVWQLPMPIHAKFYDSACLPRIIHAGQLIYSRFWGNTSSFLDCHCSQGHLHISLNDPRYEGIVLLEMMVPTYLSRVTPIIIFHDMDTQGIRLLFLRGDNSPELFVLFETWDSLRDKIRYSVQRRLSLNDGDLRLSSIASMLAMISTQKLCSSEQATHAR